jgi:chromosome segregation ATPase
MALSIAAGAVAMVALAVAAWPVMEGVQGRAALEAQRVSLTGEVRELEAKVGGLGVELAALDRKRDQALIAARSSEQQARVAAQAATDASRIKADRDAAEAARSAAEKARDAAVEKRDALLTEVQGLQKQQDALGGDVRGLISAKTVADEQHDKADTRLAELSDQVSEVEQRLANLKAERENSQKLASAAADERRAMQNALLTAKDELDAASRDADSAQENEASLRDTLAKLEERRDGLATRPCGQSASSDGLRLFEQS